MHFTWLMPPGPYRVMTCQEKELTLDHLHTFLTTQGHGGHPWMRDQLNTGAISETTRTWKTIYTIHTCAPVTQQARVWSPVRKSFLGEVFWGFSSPVRQMSGSFRPPRSLNIIWPSLSSSFITGTNDLNCWRAQKPQYTYIHIPFTYTFILTRQIWKDDYEDQMIFGDFVGLKLPDICLTGE